MKETAKLEDYDIKVRALEKEHSISLSAAVL